MANNVCIRSWSLKVGDDIISYGATKNLQFLILKLIPPIVVKCFAMFKYFQWRSKIYYIW